MPICRNGATAVSRPPLPKESIFYALNCLGKNYRGLITSISVQTANQMRGVELRITSALSAGLLEFMMQLNWDSFLERPIRRDSSRHTLLVALVACAVGGTASAAVILALVDFAMTQASVPPLSPRAIVWNASASQDTRTAQNSPVVETPIRLAATGMISSSDEPVAQNSPVIETPTRLGATSPAHQPVAQTKAEHSSDVHSRQLRKHSRVATHEHYRRRRLAHTFSPRFSIW
jgi:hypothetical protein